MINQPTFDEEAKLKARGYRLIAGVDEVGRGALAGPVMAAAVVLYSDADIPWLDLVRDSKQLSPKQRERVVGLVWQAGIPAGLGAVSPAVIDEVGIVEATRMAMAQAVEALPCRPDFLLVDALSLPKMNLPQKGIIKGDQRSLSIACASIVAKVNRDQRMKELDSVYPGYGLASHKGYGTSQHVQSLQKLGPCAIHRRSFAPVGRSTIA